MPDLRVPRHHSCLRRGTRSVVRSRTAAKGHGFPQPAWDIPFKDYQNLMHGAAPAWTRVYRVSAEHRDERRDQMLEAMEHAEGFERLRAVIQRKLDEGIADAVLLEDLDRVRGPVSQDDEDKLLDVMDLLVGWCAPQFRLRPSGAQD